MGMLQLPAVGRLNKIETEAANYGGQVLAINKNSQHAEDAFKLITYITKGELDKKL